MSNPRHGSADDARSADYGIVASLDELVRQRSPLGAGMAPTGRVRTLHSGSYDSVFQGRGMEFAESRAYQPGDDVRTIDWRVTARTGRVHSKLFHEERERPVLLLIDLRPPMRFGTRDCFKSVLAARAAATLAWAARDAGDRVGGIVLASSGHIELAPHRSRGRLLTLLRRVSDATATGGAGGPPQVTTGAATPLHEGVARLARVARPGTLVFLLSDFDDLDEAAEREIGRLAMRCDVGCLLIHDALEAEAPSGGDYRVSDGERVMRLPTEHAAWRREYAARFAERRARLEGLCARRGIALLPLQTGQECQEVLRADRFARAFRGARNGGGRA
ncbi:MAG: DUF58 domain-containing protein [Deltaproteobacteria bacterium]|nr:DUF58 domain-containing protein [Deltaproteobacteria bacterium]